MLISKVPDSDGGQGEGYEATDEDGDSHEYQTANELFELMAKNQNFDTGDVDKLTTRDLVLLYKNIDLGTKLMSNANELKRRTPNQHVETIVYNDEPESDGSDVSDIYSNEDLHNVFLVNEERIDLLNTPSVQNTLCHKLGDLEIQTSDLSGEYEKHFLFKDPYIKEQLKSLKLMNTSTEFEGTVLPASLLDYICCKRLEDNYNFYMDNIIRYVKHTIEQLKRISNGDYLTDKAKEKWREVENTAEDLHANTKVLATSTSIPLHVERKIGGRTSTWDDIVHSAVDIRSLSKILEKKIVVEVPKIICGSYKLLSKCCADNLIISCKKEKRPVEKAIGAESRVDVVFQLQRSETGLVMSNISSIMILQTTPVVCEALPEILPLPYKEITRDDGSPERKVKIIELEPIPVDETVDEPVETEACYEQLVEGSFVDSIDYACSDNDGSASVKNSSYHESSDSSDALRDILDRKLMFPQKEASCDVFPDDLRLTIQKLTMQGALTEESGEDNSQSTGMRKKSPMRVRIKSPYENQSYIMEEKKRRRLLEIRERRERKKMALAENCKITKHKYGKGAVMPQSASSVTKLSISNKSFYNSIYGQSMNVDPTKQQRGRNRKGKREVLEIGLESVGGEQDAAQSTPDRNSKKYINRSYYLDDAVTEMMYMNMKRNENDGKDLCSTSTSVISNDFRNNLNLLSQLIAPSDTEINMDNEDTSPERMQLLNTSMPDDINSSRIPKALLTSKSILNIVPSNSPNVEELDTSDSKKVISSVECRKSIDKIYTLMKKLGKVQDNESKSSKSKYTAHTSEKAANEAPASSTFQGSDSGTSLKHHLTSSNPSSFSFDKNHIDKANGSYNLKPGSPTAVVPKVIISSKSSSVTQKTEPDRPKKERRRSLASPTIKVPENPLRAISQLLHEFENVQKTRHKPNTDQKSTKKTEVVSSDGKSGSRQSSFKRRSRLDQHNDAQNERYVRVMTPKEKKPRQYNMMDMPKIPYQQSPVEDKHAEKLAKKKITEMLDEAKEARGEAVRGPSKFNSRLHSLAQPKRTYVQAHSEEYQNKYGKTLMADRLQRLAAAPPATALDRNSGSANSRSKGKRSGTEAVSAVSVKPPPSPGPPLERERARARHSSSSSPERKEKLNQGVGQSYKQTTVPETPQTLRKKMVAVESYVKNHYGRATSVIVNPTVEPQGAQKSRVPLIPHDLDMVSSTSSPIGEGSTELGSRLHHIINSIIKTTSKGLEVLTECHESNSKISRDNTDDYSLAENLSRTERVSSESDYALDVLDDNNVLTSVEKIDDASENKLKLINGPVTDATQYDLQPFRSATELEKLENALCNHISVGAFHKRLRLKNLTLTPKQSMQQVFVLQSGDAGSLVVKAPKQNCKDSKADNLSDLSALPVLSKSNLDWSFANFPVQISTVGYAFPEYKSLKCASTSLVKLFDKVTSASEEETAIKSTNIDIQCYNSEQPRLRIEQAAQVDVPAATLVTIGISSTLIAEPDPKVDTKQTDATQIEVMPAFIDVSINKTEEENFYCDHKQVNILDDPNYCVSAVDTTHVTNPVEDKPHVTLPAMDKSYIIVPNLDKPHVIIPSTDKPQVTVSTVDKSHGSVLTVDKPDIIAPTINKFHVIAPAVDKLDGIAAKADSILSTTDTPDGIAHTVDKPENIEYTTSLDILVGLLNEIQKITTCQTQITNSSDKNHIENQQSKELETLLNKAAALDNSIQSTACDVISFTSLDRLRQLESNTSLYSFYLSDNEMPENSNSRLNFQREILPLATKELLCSKPIYADKEVSVDIIDKEFANRFTDVPSQIFPLGMNHSTNITNSLIGVLSEPSTQSMFSFAEYHSVYSNSSSLGQKTIIDVPQIIITRESNQSLAFYEINNKAIEKPPENKTYNKKKMKSFGNKNRITKNGNVTNNTFRLKTDFDPIMKMKRDILVTVYSILVFTVFAALSFPEMLYRV